MNCDQIQPYIPGFVGGDLRPETSRIVGEHVDGCASCGETAAMQRRVVTSLATLPAKMVEPPPYLLDSILDSVGERRVRRVLPLLPVGPLPAPVQDAARVVSEHRDAIASAAGTALVAAGAAYALWRAVRARPRQQPVTS